MATETLQPDVELSDVGLVASGVTDHDADPDSDSSVTAATGNNVETEYGVDFPAPTGNPTVGAGLQEFRAGVIEFDSGQTGTPQARLELWENGSLVRAGTLVDISTFQILSFAWNANELATPDGSLVQCKVISVKTGGGPGKRNTVNIGQIEWNAEYSISAPIAIPINAFTLTASIDSLAVLAPKLVGVSAFGLTGALGSLVVLNPKLIGVNEFALASVLGNVGVLAGSAPITVLVNPFELSGALGNLTVQNPKIVGVSGFALTSLLGATTIVRPLNISVNELALAIAINNVTITNPKIVAITPFVLSFAMESITIINTSTIIIPVSTFSLIALFDNAIILNPKIVGTAAFLLALTVGRTTVPHSSHLAPSTPIIPTNWHPINPRMRRFILQGILPELFSEEDKNG